MSHAGEDQEATFVNRKKKSRIGGTETEPEGLSVAGSKNMDIKSQAQSLNSSGATHFQNYMQSQ